MSKIIFFSLILLSCIFLVSCEKKDDSVIDPFLTFPQILNVYAVPQTITSNPINPVIIAIITSLERIKSVKLTLSTPDNVFVREYELKDDGILPDTNANDGRYTVQINENQSCRISGTYKVEVIAENESGTRSNTFILNFDVLQINNQPPAVSTLSIIPDSIKVNISDFFIFTIRVVDPNGQCDIKRVWYEGNRPDGTALTPFDLFDDGSCCFIGNTGVTSGDISASDSIFTRKFWGSAPQIGYYVYRLRAVDRSSDTSNILSDSIYVYP